MNANISSSLAFWFDLTTQLAVKTKNKVTPFHPPKHERTIHSAQTWQCSLDYCSLWKLMYIQNSIHHICIYTKGKKEQVLGETWTKNTHMTSPRLETTNIASQLKKLSLFSLWTRSPSFNNCALQSLKSHFYGNINIIWHFVHGQRQVSIILILFFTPFVCAAKLSSRQLHEQRPKINVTTKKKNIKEK